MIDFGSCNSCISELVSKCAIIRMLVGRLFHTSIGMVMASFGWPPGPVFPSSFSLLFSDGVVCEGALPPRPSGNVAAAEPGLGAKATASGVCAEPGGGKLGGGMEVGSMVGRARAGDADAPAAKPPGADMGACMARDWAAGGGGRLSSMGANLAVEEDASLRRDASLLRGGIMCQMWGQGGCFDSPSLPLLWTGKWACLVGTDCLLRTRGEGF